MMNSEGMNHSVLVNRGGRLVVRYSQRLRQLLWSGLPLLTFVALIALWELVVHIFAVPTYVLPDPLHVLVRLYKDRAVLWQQTVVTAEEVVLGFGIVIVTAIPLGLLIALSPIAKHLLYPGVVFVQLIPKIAVAPLFVVWLGFGMQSKLLLTILMTFFPLLLAGITGFSILDVRLLYITRSMGASGWQTFRYLRLPAALPVIFSGLKTSATLAVTAAIVAEFVGSNNGLGYELLQATSTLDTELIFAVLLVLTLLGLALNYIVEFFEYILQPWQRVGRD
ncbi:MAG: ABC transporter permease [Alicyclobacillus sp.]|nr:ABC transporter permease [Alicyclobacillus sp.]